MFLFLSPYRSLLMPQKEFLQGYNWGKTLSLKGQGWQILVWSGTLSRQSPRVLGSSPYLPKNAHTGALHVKAPLPVSYSWEGA